jgi:hypothetical protein
MSAEHYDISVEVDNRMSILTFCTLKQVPFPRLKKLTKCNGCRCYHEDDCPLKQEKEFEALVSSIVKPALKGDASILASTATTLRTALKEVEFKLKMTGDYASFLDKPVLLSGARRKLNFAGSKRPPSAPKKKAPTKRRLEEKPEEGAVALMNLSAPRVHLD